MVYTSSLIEGDVMTWTRLLLLSLLVGCGDAEKEEGGADTGAFGAPAALEPCGEGFGRADDGNCYPIVSSSGDGPGDGGVDTGSTDGGGSGSDDGGSGSTDGAGTGSGSGAGTGIDDGSGSGSTDGGGSDSGSGSTDGGGSGSDDGSGSGAGTGSDDGSGSGESESRMIVEVAAGGYHTCVRYADNTLDCWGRNDYSQANPPTTTYKEITAGYFHTCAIATEGDVDCWGDNTSGQSVPQEGDFTKVSAGYRTSCAVSTDGSPVCWGSWSGMTGSWDEETEEYLDYGSIMSLTDVDVGYSSCGVDEASVLHCWDGNHHSRDTSLHGIGYEDLIASILGEGVPIIGFSAYDGVVQTAVGGAQVCVITEEATIECFGASWWSVTSSIPGGTSTTSDIIEIDAGISHFCALDSTGPISCWGDDEAGQSSPPAGFFDYIQVSVGIDHSCGLEADGNLVCWGSDEDGQLGEYGY
jgi:hypothetical protein